MEWIQDAAFLGCVNLKTANLSKVTQLYLGAFNGCTSLSSVVLGSVKGISTRSFHNCTSLTSINLPKSLESISPSAFSYSNVSTVTYEGTMAEWNAVNLQLDWNGNAPITYVICSDGTVTIVRTLMFQVKVSDTTSVGYSFEDGMDWYRWVSSQYNTAGYEIRGYKGKAAVCLMDSENMGYALKYNGSFVDPNKDAIIAGTYEREYVYPITSNAPGGST